MWHRGLWQTPVFVQYGLALARIEYMDLPEPKEVVEFRERYDGLRHFTWVPQDGEPWQHVFLRRHWDSVKNVMLLEMLIWDRIEDVENHFYVDALALQTMTKVLGDMTGSDKRRGAVLRQERMHVAGRAAVDEAGAPTWYAFEGRWIKEEQAFAKHQREARSRAKAIKERGTMS